jgi:Flp pilus assembly protein TadD
MPQENSAPKQWPYYLLIALTALIAYLPVFNAGFLNYDDNLYITQNEFVQRGLSWANTKWAFGFHPNIGTYWHPLIWLSFMLDYDLFKLDPLGYHLENLAFHAANAIVLFAMLRQVTGATRRSALVALLFALHPLNVESVAWIAERKTVLCTLLAFATLWSYARYTVAPGVKRYLPVLAFFIVGLTAKSMLVTLPFLMLLLDFWPLRRLSFEIRKEQGPALGKLLLEKVPFFALSVGSVVISILSMKGTINPPGQFEAPLTNRLANMAVSYCNYLLKTIWPTDMAAYYPLQTAYPAWQVIAATLFLAGVTWAAIRYWRQFPWLAVGWFWYAGTMFPVSGLVRAGLWPAMADRFCYIPLLGVFIIISWGLHDLLSSRWGTKSFTVATVIIALALLPVTYHQTGFWKNESALFNRALDVTKDNYIMLTGLAFQQSISGELELAEKNFIQAIKLNRDYHKPYECLGDMYTRMGRFNEAETYLHQALKLYPYSHTAQAFLAEIYNQQKKPDRAAYHYSELLKLRPSDIGARRRLGVALTEMGDLKGANTQFNIVLKASQDNPKDLSARYNLGYIYVTVGKLQEAEQLYSTILKADIKESETNREMGIIRVKQGKIDEAEHFFRQALIRRPNSVLALSNLGVTLAMQKKYAEARTHLKEALRIEPRNEMAKTNIQTLERLEQGIVN